MANKPEDPNEATKIDNILNQLDNIVTNEPVEDWDWELHINGEEDNFVIDQDALHLNIQ